MKVRHLIIAAVGMLFLLVSHFSLTWGEDVRSLIRQGDKLYSQRADLQKCKESAEDYKKALAIDPNNYEANWKLCRSLAYIGYAAPTKETKVKLEKVWERNLGPIIPFA